MIRRGWRMGAFNDSPPAWSMYAGVGIGTSTGGTPCDLGVLGESCSVTEFVCSSDVCVLDSLRGRDVVQD